MVSSTWEDCSSRSMILELERADYHFDNSNEGSYLKCQLSKCSNHFTQLFYLFFHLCTSFL